MGSIVDVGLEEGLVALEEHLWLDWYLLVQIEPRAIRALLAFIAIHEDPAVGVLVEHDRRLHLGQQFIVDTDVTVGGAADDDLLVLKLATVEVRMLRLGDREDSEFQFWRWLADFLVTIGG